ncbi:MAG: restriction endonuclease subunit S [Methylococcales bacterium]|nr:restriction endonuclease subunit S [Methylococcales bacterium]
MSVPALRFKEFSGDWEHISLGEISKDVKYGMNSAAIPFDGFHKYIRITDIDEETREFIPSPLSSPDGKIEEKYKLKIGDLVFARTGASVGKSYLYKEKDGDLYFAGFLIKISIVGYHPYFIYTKTLTQAYKCWLSVMSMRSGQPGVNAEELKEYSFLSPSLPEQTKIANFLTAVDDKITLLTQKATLLSQYKKGVMQQIFSQELRFKDDDGQEFPEWDVIELETIATKVTKKNKGLDINEVLTNSATQGIVSQSDYFDREIANQKNLSGYYVVEVNDFVYNPRISTNALVGPIKRNNLKVGVMSPLYTVFRFKEGNLVFFEQYFQTTQWHDYMKSVSNSGARHDRMNITNESFIGMPLPYPTIKEQTKIANFLTAIDEKITTHQTQLNAVKQYKQGLLQQMFV